MIPKIIHYCWLSQDPYPALVQKCIGSWKRQMPDYEIRLWDLNQFPPSLSIWVKQAVALGKYQAASDYIRAYALYNFGGIYFDSDVEAHRPFDSLLSLPYALCWENGSGCLEAAVMAAERRHPLFKALLNYFESCDGYIDSDGEPNKKTLPQIIQEILPMEFCVTSINSLQEFDSDPKKLCVLPCTYFSPKHVATLKIERSECTFTTHHFAASWTTGWHKWRNCVKRVLGPWLTERALSLTSFAAKRRLRKTTEKRHKRLS